MAYKNVLNFVLKKIRCVQPLILYGSSIFIHPDPSKDLKIDQKLQFETPSYENLSYEYLFKQSSLNAAHSATQALTITYCAIETTSKEYRDLLKKLIALMNEGILHRVPDAHWDEIVEIRCQMQDKKKTLTQFLLYMEYVHKMAEAAAEISFLAGMDNLSSSLNLRIDDALVKVHNEKTKNIKLEEEYVRVQEKAINDTSDKDHSVPQFE